MAGMDLPWLKHECFFRVPELSGEHEKPPTGAVLKIGRNPEGSSSNHPSIQLSGGELLVSGRVTAKMAWFGKLLGGWGNIFCKYISYCHDFCHYFSIRKRQHNNLNISEVCFFGVQGGTILCGFYCCLCWGLNAPILRHKMSGHQVWGVGILNPPIFFCGRKNSRLW